VLRFRQAWGVDDPGVQRFIAASADMVYRRGEGLTGRAWDSGEPLWVSDVMNDARCAGPSHQIALRTPAVGGGAFVFPLLEGPRTIGVLTFSSAAVRAPDERLLRAIQVIGSQLRQFLERKRSEAVLRESERRFQLFIDNAPGMVWIKDSSLRYSYVNRAWEQTNKRSAVHVLGKDDYQVFPSEFADLVRRDDEDVLKGGQIVQKPRQLPQSLRDEAGGPALQHFITVKFPLADVSGKTGIAGIGVDMTERVRAEELATRYATDVRRLLNRLVETQESERRKLAHDLHDLIGQNLTALGIELAALKAQLAGTRQEAALRLNAMAGLVDGTVDAIRGVMSALRPPALEEFGLLGALRSHAAEFGARTGMQLAIDFPERELRLAPDTELGLFRIVQEALTNAAKHSGGSRVQITLARQAGGLRLCIADDGRGFSEAAVRARRDERGGWGLPAMYERAQALGGTLGIEFPGHGTSVVVELPSRHAD
jgi:PAS domain S-box-containing protein